MVVRRFQVMATLQAARAHVLGLPLESAYSWGLNRSIFYAAAKRGFAGGAATSAGGKSGSSSRDGPSDVYYLGEDMAFKSDQPGRSGSP